MYAAGFLAPSAIMCYANATAALVSMLNFIIFFFLYKKEIIQEQYTEKLRQGNENSKESTAERKKRLLEAE